MPLKVTDRLDEAAGLDPQARIAVGTGVGAATGQVTVDLRLQALRGGSGTSPVPNLCGAGPTLEHGGEARGDGCTRAEHLTGGGDRFPI